MRRFTSVFSSSVVAWASGHKLNLHSSCTCSPCAEKIGIAEATAEYTNRLLPIIQAHPDVFPSAKFESCFSLEWFHVQGSRILSRSFGVEGVKGQTGPEVLEEREEGRRVDVS